MKILATYGTLYKVAYCRVSFEGGIKHYRISGDASDSVENLESARFKLHLCSFEEMNILFTGEKR